MEALKEAIAELSVWKNLEFNPWIDHEIVHPQSDENIEEKFSTTCPVLVTTAEEVTNYEENDDGYTTAAKCTLEVNNKETTAIIDSGAATCIITVPLLEQLQLKLSRTSRFKAVNANGEKIRSLGIVDNVIIKMGEVDVLTSFQIFPSQEKFLILGNDWLRAANAILDWTNSILIVQIANDVYQVPITYTETYGESEMFLVEIAESDLVHRNAYMDNMDHHTFKRRRLGNGGLEVATEKWVTDGSAEESEPTDEVICTCSYSDPVDWDEYTKSYQEPHFNELLKSQEELILETDTEENANGWSHARTEMPTPNDYTEDDWGVNYPDSETNTKPNEEKDLIYTVAYTFTRKEFEDMYRSHIRVRQVIAGQPITRGGFKCDDFCDIDNHHVHTYCKACQRNLPYGTVVHNCKIGLEPGKIHPDMDPNYLINKPWWIEPPRVQMENFVHFLKLLFKFLKTQASRDDNHILTPEGLAVDLD